MTRMRKRILGLVIIAGVGALLVWAFIEGRREMAKEAEREGTIKTPSRVTRTEDGTTVITLDHETQERIALKVQALEAAALRPETVAYGVLAEDPSRSLTLRAPLAGVVHQTKDRSWPNIGQHVADAEVVGTIVPRFGPMDRVDLKNRLATAEADVKEDEAELLAARASFENKKRLNVENKIVSDRTLEEVEAKVKAWEARLAAARENVRTLADSLQQASGPGQPMPLAVEMGGEVVECLCRPGEAVESGQALLRVERFDRLIAKVELPAGQTADAPKIARIIVNGREAHPQAGEFLGYAPDVNAKTRGQGFLFRVEPGDLPFRPGMAVTAYMPLPGEALAGVTVPRAAVVRFGGAAWAYVHLATPTSGPAAHEEKEEHEKEKGSSAKDEKKDQHKPAKDSTPSGDAFARREVNLDHPTESGWFVTKGFNPGSRVVVEGAQTLLSEELKSQFESEAE